MRALIAGAGIGGLTAALSLHAAGIEALVIDSAAALRPLGVGINLMPHAVRELTELGLGGELAATGIPTAEMVHFDRHGNRIWGFACGLSVGYRWPQYSIHRGELQTILLAAVRARLRADAVRTATAFAGFTESSSGVVVRVRDRSSAALSELAADVLVGADGLYSGVRAQLHPGAIVDGRVLAYLLARAASPAQGLAEYEAARRETVNAIVLACRDMPADRLLHTVSVRAPDGFGRIEDVLSAAELAAFDRAYRTTTLPDVAALNSRASLTP